jgi:hypothetical protein
MAPSGQGADVLVAGGPYGIRGSGLTAFRALAVRDVEALRQQLKHRARLQADGAATSTGGEAELHSYGHNVLSAASELSSHESALRATPAQRDVEGSSLVVTDLTTLPKIPVHALTTSAAQAAHADDLDDAPPLTERSDRSSCTDKPPSARRGSGSSQPPSVAASPRTPDGQLGGAVRSPSKNADVSVL